MYGLCVLFSYRVVSIRSRCYSSGSSKRLLEILANMPKANSARIAEAQRQRQQISKKSEKYGPSTVYLQVLGSGAKGAPNTLYLFTDQKRYLFNCGECTQRLAHEHKVKLSRLDHIFITSKTWQCIGGLPGLSLTLQDVGVPNITLHGPDGLDELYNATKRFVIMKDMNVTMAKCSPSADFEDNVMTVKYVQLGPLDNLLTPQTIKQPVKKNKPEGGNTDKEFEEFIHDETDYYKREGQKGQKDKSKAKQHVVEKADLIKKKTEKVLHELQKKTHCTVAYICTLKKRLGTLDLAKCVELGVKPGPMLGQLKNGQDVVLPDGSLVLSKNVKTPDDPGPVFIVLDVPDPSYLKESEFQAHFHNDTNPPENVPVLIVHFTPPHVLHHPTYVSFMSMFGPSTRHLVLNTQNACLGSEAVHRTQHKLHLLDADIFPLLRDVSVPAVWHAPAPVPKTNSPIRLRGLEELKNKIALAQFQNIINLEGPCKGDGQVLVEDKDSEFKMEVLAGRTLTMFHLRPMRQLDRSAEPKLHIQDYIQETMDADGFVSSLQQFRRLVDSMRYAKSDAQEYPKVVFLGTGSCIPSKTRNTSAIVVQVSENRSILLDCGEGTFGQLVRFYGSKKVNGFLRTLQAIYISHLHADHHIGLIGVLQARRQAFAEEPDSLYTPACLLAPGQIVTWLTLYDQQFERIKNDYTLIPNQNLLHEAHISNPELTSAALAAMGVLSIQTCLVAHCPNAFGVAIQVTRQYKLTYSGDTLPCEELVKIGEESTLLIHEATMEDELAEEARTKMHSTTTQAIEIGRQMNARYTVLTHFSQRYARLPRLNANILNNNHSVGIAFDNMQITMSDLELLPHMYAPLQLMFAEHCVEMELKAAQRQRLRERRSSESDPTHPELSGESRRGGAGQALQRHSAGPRSANAPNYRESNSSRLRQEMKGMTVTGIVGKPPPRSRSSSAARKGSQRNHSRSPPPPQHIHKAQIDRPDRPSAEREKEECLPEKVTDLTTTPRSLSETSSLSRDVQDRSRMKRGSSGIIDTRSKTINTVPQRATAEEVLDTMANNGRKTRSKPINTVPQRATAEEVLDIMANNGRRTPISNRQSPPMPRRNTPDNNAYGKPLVTSLNKRLTIRREESCSPSPPIINKERITAAPCSIRTKSPTILKKVYNTRERSPTIHRPTSELGYTRLPTKATISGNKLRASNTSPNVLPNTKIPVLKNCFGPRPVTAVRPSTLHQNKSNTNKTLAKEATLVNYVTKDAKSRNKPAQRYPTHQSHMNARPGSQSSPPSSPRCRSPLRNPVTDTIKKTYGHKKDNYNESRPKPITSTDASCSQPPRTFANTHGSVRSFKPQLEDIKSSYLLLNKNVQDVNLKTSCVKTGLARSKSPIPLPTTRNVFNEELRKQQLMDIKKKFKSKQFWGESKYDKIEGLNWISWK